MRYSGALAALVPIVVQAALPLSKQHPLIARVNQPYSWSLSPLTFDDADTSSISLRNAPDWLVYDNATSTFRGRPGAEDVGVTTVRVRNSRGTADHFLLCVSDLPPPTINIPLASQLVPGNPSISSGVTFPPPGVGVRVPPTWSFSIGFDGYTFITADERKVFYDATLDNGLSLPNWVAFNNQTMTFDGVAPPGNRATTLSIILHGSDRPGFGAIHQQFDLAVGPRTHLLGTDGTGGLETVNVTGGVPFMHSIQTFGGIVIDGAQVVSANVSRVEMNVSSVPWVTFDSTSRVLTGLPPLSAIGQHPYVLPVLITSDYNDTLATNLSIVAFPSYFATGRIPPLRITPGSFLTFSTQQYFSHARSAQAAVALGIVPRAASSWLSYNSLNDTLNGFIPRSATYNEVNVTFYATDLETHAVSAVSILLSIASNETLDPGVWDQAHGISHSAQAKTAIIVTFSVVGGVILLCCLLALCRRYCGVREFEEDDESVSRWKNRELTAPSMHHVPLSGRIMRSVAATRTSTATTDRSSDDGCKSSMSPVVSINPADLDIDPAEKTMKKVHFFRNLVTPSKRKLRAHAVGLRPGNIRRSQISRPSPISDDGTLARMSIVHTEGGSRSDDPTSSGGLVADHVGAVDSVPGLAWAKAGPSMRGSQAPPLPGSAQVTFSRSSQASSISDGSSLTSIPRRRSDFLPPRGQQMAASDQVHEDTSDSIATSGSSGSVNLDHGDNAVISVAARQTIPPTASIPSPTRAAIRSSLASSTSVALKKYQSSPGSPGGTSVTGIRQPRLVQLDSEHRVPTPPRGEASTTRKVSQKAVFKDSYGHVTQSDVGETDPDQRLSLGIHYVSGLGGNGDDSESAVFYLTPSVGKANSPIVGERSSSGAGQSGIRPTPEKVLDKGETRGASRQPAKRISIGAPFAISVQFETIPARGADLLVRQQNGKPAPGWINLDQRDVELWGVPLREHRGMHMLEIVESSESGQRVVARMDLEVVDWE